MVDPEKVRQLIEMMAEHELSEICWRSGEEEIQLKRPGSLGQAVGPSCDQVNHGLHHAGLPMSHPPLMATAPLAAPAVPPAATTPPVDDDAGLLTIKSPMVGTLYVAPDPDSSPFISVGDRVAHETVVCIVEAMKVFNEIKAELAGTIQKVLVKNGEPVEFGQPLFLVKPD